MARRMGRLHDAAKEAGPGTLAIECDATDPSSARTAITQAASAFDGLDSLVYTPAIGPLAALEDTDAETWRRVFDTNVIGASVMTAAALPHLEKTKGSVVYLSSVSASLTPPWPGLGAYAVSKAALDKLVEAWLVEHPTINFTRMVVGNCAGGEGDSLTEFANQWDPELFEEFHAIWTSKNYLGSNLLDAEDLVAVVHSILEGGASVSMPSVVVAPRPAIG
jgi:NAD(P)-dependent dehydrogenase (short-subunit alcohol dehydrogenase family)